MSIGKIIKELRETKNISRGELACEACTVRHLTLIENGERNPSSILLYLFGSKLNENLID